nr:C45 family peptidase [uncultured Blautia sp.]
MYCFESDHGCSVFAVHSGEHTYFGRNMDMFPEYKKTSESVLYMPENQNIFLAHSTAMICVEDGMNEHGLAAALTFLLPKTVKPGINGGFLIRLILEECKTAEEAARLLQNIPISSVHNIVVADSMGEMFVAECTAEQVSVRWCEKYTAATNHFITPEMQRYNAEDENWYQTRDRLATLESVLVDEHMTFDDIVQGICNEALERKVELNEICNNRYGCFCDFYDIRSDYLF